MKVETDIIASPGLAVMLAIIYDVIIFIAKLDIFPLMCFRWKSLEHWTDLDPQKY